MSEYIVKVEIIDGDYCREHEKFCQFYWENEDGEHGCSLLNKFEEFGDDIEDIDYEMVKKFNDCPSIK